MKILRSFKKIRRSFGWRGTKVAIEQLFARDIKLVSVMSPHYDRRTYFRLNTTDASIYHQMFVNREYEIPFKFSPKIIVDAGANIGLAAIYFALRFPEARILALEPEKSNFAVLVKNTASFSNIVPINKALWHESTALALFEPNPGQTGLQKDGFQTFDRNSSEAPMTTGCVDATSIEDLMAEFSLDHIDILKIDIEGSEREVFQHAAGWIEKIQVIIAEFHDRMRPGCSRAFYAATGGFAMELRKGENVIVGRAGTLILPTR